jgi:Potential Queuosine, Q, salvage protein family
VRAACEGVVERAVDVGLGSLDRALAALADRSVPSWDRLHHYSGPADRTLRYVLVLDTINFSFWRGGAPGEGLRPAGAEGGPPPSGGSAGGYYQLAERIRDVFRSDEELSDETRLADITADRLRELLGDFPMLDQRAAALRELGRNGFEGLVQPSAAGTASALAERLASYRDVAVYRGHEVPLLKRAQILPADLHGAGLARFPDLGGLTCFADYKLPQVLRHMGALEYSEALARRVDDWQELAPGEPAEVEIRASTVVCVERLREALAGRGRDLLSIEVDWLLWGLSQEIFPMRPYHRTRTVFY